MTIIQQKDYNELKFVPLEDDEHELATYCEKLRQYKITNLEKITKIII